MTAKWRESGRLATDNNNAVLPAAKAYFYDAGTSTPRTVYSDQGLTTPHATPVLANSSGRWPDVFVPSGLYDWLVKTGTDVAVAGYFGNNEDPSVAGGVSLAVASGGTGASNAAGALSNLGAASASDLTSLTTTVGDKLSKTSAGDTLGGNINNSATGFFAVPRGTTAQRASATSGCPLRYNDTLQKVEYYDPFLGAWVQLPTAGLSRGYIDGLITANNTLDAANDIDFSAGVCRSDDDTTDIICTAMTKRLDAGFSAGTNNGMIDGGAKATSTWYHLFAIYNPTSATQDYLASTSATAPTLPSGFTKKRRIGAIYTDSGGTITPYTQFSNEFLLKQSVQTVVNGAITAGTAILQQLRVPTGVKVLSLISVGHRSGTSAILVTSPDQDDVASGPTARFTVNNQSSGTSAQVPHYPIRTNTSGQVRIRSDNSGNYDLVTHGWIDARGKE